MATPHDALFKYTFGNPEHARGLLRSLLPPALVRAIDWKSLALVPGSFVDPRLAQHHTDLLYRCRIGEREVFLYLLFLLEHRSRRDPALPLDLLRYMSRGWEQEFSREGHITPIIPVVIHHGDAGWSAPNDLLHLFRFEDTDPAVVEALRPFLPDFRFVLDDLTAVPEAELFAREQTALSLLTTLCFQRIRAATDPTAELVRWHRVVRAVRAARSGAEALTAILSYVLIAGEAEPERVQLALAPAGPDAQETLMNTAEQLMARGRIQGRIEMLRTQLETRFGPLPSPIQDRLTHATPEDLDRWTRRVLTAPTLDDVFA